MYRYVHWFIIWYFDNIHTSLDHINQNEKEKQWLYSCIIIYFSLTTTVAIIYIVGERDLISLWCREGNPHVWLQNQLSLPGVMFVQQCLLLYKCTLYCEITSFLVSMFTWRDAYPAVLVAIQVYTPLWNNQFFSIYVYLAWCLTSSACCCTSVHSTMK